MYKVCLLSTLLAVSVHANGYGADYGAAGGLSGGGLSAGGFSGGNGLLDSGNLADFSGFGEPFSGGAKLSCIGEGCGGNAAGGLGALPILRTQKVDFVNVPQQIQAPAEPANLLVDSHMNPISLVYRSFGAPINIIQKHIPSQPTFKQSQTEEEPHRHLHVIKKPVIQEVREIIVPQRLVRQEILPVHEEIQTIVAKATPVAPAPVAAPVLASGGLAGGLGGAGLTCSGAGCGGLAGSAVRLSKGRGGRLVAGPAIGVATGDFGSLAAVGKAY